MNRIGSAKLDGYRCYSVAKLCDMINEHTAFIGHHEDGNAERDGLFLITFSRVVDAMIPAYTWTEDTNFYVKKFVNVVMAVEEEE